MSNKNLFTTKSVVAIAIPLTIVAIQGLIRYSADKDFSSIGITLSSIGIGQIFPFIVFENFLLGKIFGLKEEAAFTGDGMITIVYKTENKGNLNLLKEIRLMAYIFFLVNIVLFISTIILNLKGHIWSHILTGMLSCLISWYYTIKY
jgi:hypothetical protein